ncbi:hypothetical protein NX794_27645 [Streptomyces sp. LP11]|uniref:Secreted protein n=1 Tax=Streptomyces pyxinicus TaxID=2970331 RepID=A0ABT2B940_9ACTN|nr:hypothetical protein [Streptomyces sp. LP11]MCS0604955.1 hypothetical protein [Streptomyces sp. LP11]
MLRRIGGGIGTAVLAVAGLMAGGATASAADSTVRAVSGPEVGPGEVSWAQCPDGTQLVGGGYSAAPAYTYGGAYSDTVQASAPSVSHPGAWAAQPHAGRIRAYALCDSGSAPTRAVADHVRNGGDTSYAQCPANTNLVTGGYAINPVYSVGGTPYDSVDVNGPSESRPNAWAARSHTKEGHIQAFALCRDIG